MNRAHRWFLSLRAYSFTASLMPAALAAAIALTQREPLLWWTYPIYVVAAVLFHAGTNVLNDYYDHIHGVDRPEDAEETHVIDRGIVSARFMKISGHLYFLIGIAIGSTIGIARGGLYVALGIAGAVGAYFYTGARFSFKYVALGDVLVFLLMGPALVAMGVWALAGRVTAGVIPLSLPVALLVTAILHGNNLRDRQSDREAGVSTLANLMSRDAARWFFSALVLAPFIMVPLLVGNAVLHPLGLSSMLAAPLAYRLSRRVFDSGADLSRLPLESAALHLAFSAVYAAAIAAAAVWP